MLPGTGAICHFGSARGCQGRTTPTARTPRTAAALNGEQPGDPANEATATQEIADCGGADCTDHSAGCTPGADADAAPATPQTAVPGPPISIKGRADGLVVEIGKGSWSEILAALDDRLQQSASFFRNAGASPWTWVRVATEAELAPLLDLLKTHGLMLGAVRTSTERTFQAALALGLTATLESVEGAPVADAAPASTNAAPAHTSSTAAICVLATGCNARRASW